MAGGNFEEGLRRASAKEINNQKQGRGSDVGTPKRSLGISTKSNPTTGGGINRPTAGKKGRAGL